MGALQWDQNLLRYILMRIEEVLDLQDIAPPSAVLVSESATAPHTAIGIYGSKSREASLWPRSLVFS